MQKSRSYPGDPMCANYDSAKKNIIVEKILSNLISTRAILKIWYLPSLCRTRFTIFKSNEIRGYYYCICHAKRIASKTSDCPSGMIDVTKQTLESKFDQVPEFKECVLQCSDKTEFLEASYDGCLPT